VKKVEVKHGIIKGFRGSWGSGVAVLELESGSGVVDKVLCDNAPTVRAFRRCFGSRVIAPGHRVNIDALKGRKILYSVDDLGFLVSFSPVNR